MTYIFLAILLVVSLDLSYLSAKGAWRCFPANQDIMLGEYGKKHIALRH